VYAGGTDGLAFVLGFRRHVDGAAAEHERGAFIQLPGEPAPFEQRPGKSTRTIGRGDVCRRERAIARAIHAGIVSAKGVCQPGQQGTQWRRRPLPARPGENAADIRRELLEHRRQRRR
jgi:hypothetical protein